MLHLNGGVYTGMELKSPFLTRHCWIVLNRDRQASRLPASFGMVRVINQTLACSFETVAFNAVVLIIDVIPYNTR